jgi:hypothetical protein
MTYELFFQSMQYMVPVNDSKRDYGLAGTRLSHGLAEYWAKALALSQL